MRVLVSGGGTGGHIYPALAIAAALQAQHQAEVLFLGSDDGLETEIVPAAGLRLATIKAGRLRRYISQETITGVLRVPLGMFQAIGIVRKFRADVAFTSGGFVSVPAALAARLNGVPLLMHQQDVPPNLSNRLAAPLAKRISVAFADSLRYFPAKKTVLLGNPVRQAVLDVFATAPQEARRQLGFEAGRPLLLVTGGSQGARHLNMTFCRALPALLARCPGLQVLQISGKDLYDETRTLADSILAGEGEQGKAAKGGEQDELWRRYRLVAYLNEEMPLALQAADLVLCRSGASTLTELATLGKPAILVPLSPAVGGSAQEANAAMFARQGAAVVLKNEDLAPDVLVERAQSLLSSPEQLEAMARAASSFARPQATQDIIKEIVNIANKRR